MPADADGKPAYPVTNVSSAAEVTDIQAGIASEVYSADTAYAFVARAFDDYTVGDMLSITENDVSVLFHISGTSVDVDQHYDPSSENAQSGIAVSEAFPTETEVETINLSHS